MIGKTLLAVFVVASVLLPAPAPAADAASPPQPTGAAPDQPQGKAALQDMLRADPNNADAHVKLGRIYLNEGRFALAEAEARAARRNGGQQDAADALLAWTLLMQGNRDTLFTQIKPGQRAPADESIVRLSLGLANLDPRSYANAGPLLNDAVQLDPKSLRARIALARFLILRRQLPEAHQQLDAARAINANQIGVIRISAELALVEGDLDGAIAQFSKVIEADPTGLPALAGRADALIREGKLAEAHQDVSTARKVVSNPQLLFLDALILARQGKMTEADQLLTRASTAFARVRIGYYLQGVVKFWLGLPETADASLTQFVGEVGDVPGAVRLRAEIARQRKDPRKAIALLTQVVQSNPADQAAVTALAGAYVANRQPDQAMALYQRVTTAAPANRNPPVDAGRLIMFYGDAVGDLPEIEKVISKQQPDTVVPLAALSRGDIATASAATEALIAHGAVDDPVLQTLLGSVRLAQKRLPEAEAIFRGVLARTPDFEAASLDLAEVLVAEKRPDDALMLLQDLAQHDIDGQ